MRALVQRVREARVDVDGITIGAIGPGYLILLGVRTTDKEEDADFLAAKCAGLRVMEDEAGKMNRALTDVAGEALVISQFTLYGDARKGNRPSFVEAAPPEKAEALYERFVSGMRTRLGDDKVRTGRFGAMMQVGLVNDGPVTILVESREDS